MSKQKFFPSRIFAIAASFRSLIATGCSQKTAINVAANSDTSAQTQPP